jgi:CRISPR-associated protein Csy3
MTAPTMLAFTRSINPGHMLMFSASEPGLAAAKLTPIDVREEPLRGLNATMKSKEEEKSKAVLQVVESAELAAGDTVLVLMGKVLIRNQSAVPHSCNSKEFFEQHATLIADAHKSGAFADLAIRYAVTMAIGGWAWRNALEAESITTTVSWAHGSIKHSVSFVDMLPAEKDIFDVDSPEYTQHKDGLAKLAGTIETALSSGTGRGVNFLLRADLTMGIGARVYPSQEWASNEMKNKSINNWEGGQGVTRILAKLKMPNGKTQAIINDRKVGNALRVIDTWYPGAAGNSPIAIEPFGANSHKSVAFRASTESSLFGSVAKVANGKMLSGEQRLFYIAACIRGGVYGGAE